MLSWRFRNKQLHELPVSCVTACLSACGNGLLARWICAVTLYRIWIDILVFVKSWYLLQIRFLIKYHDSSSDFHEISCVVVWQQFKIECGTVTEMYRSNAPVYYLLLTFFSYRLISFTNFNAQFLYSLTTCMLHYNPRHVSSINMHIFRRTNCIITASSIATLCKRLYSISDESSLQSPLIRHTVLYCTESDDARCCDNTICPPEDGHVDARNIPRIIM